VRQRRWFGTKDTPSLLYTARIEQDGPTARVRLNVRTVAFSPVVWLGVRFGAVGLSIKKLFRIQVAAIEGAIARASAKPYEKTDPLAFLPYLTPDLDSDAARRLPDVRATLVNVVGEGP